MGQHAAKWLVVGCGKFIQAAQQGPPGAGLALGPARQFAAHLDPVLEFINRLVGASEPLFIHHPAYHQVAIKIPKVKFLLIYIRVGVADVNRGVNIFAGIFHP